MNRLKNEVPMIPIAGHRRAQGRDLFSHADVPFGTLPVRCMARARNEINAIAPKSAIAQLLQIVETNKPVFLAVYDAERLVDCLNRFSFICADTLKYAGKYICLALPSVRFAAVKSSGLNNCNPPILAAPKAAASASVSTAAWSCFHLVVARALKTRNPSVQD